MIFTNKKNKNMKNMKHIRKFNEDMDMESTGLGFKLIGSMGADEIEGDIKIGKWGYGKLPDGSELKEGYDEEGREFVLIVKDGKIEVAISEYEISNPFVFGDVIIVPGHDSITCYNLKTGEHTTEGIR
jgi:hypothetical protein